MGEQLRKSGGTLIRNTNRRLALLPFMAFVILGLLLGISASVRTHSGLPVAHSAAVNYANQALTIADSSFRSGPTIALSNLMKAALPTRVAPLPSRLSATPQAPGGNYIPATAAFVGPEVCNSSDLSNAVDEARGEPEWKPIIFSSDPRYQLPNNPPTILEGTVPTPSVEYPTGELSDNQATSEVSEEELPWNHDTHDFTFKVVPDLAYSHLLSSWVNKSDGSIGFHTDMEVEWENASLMDEQPEGFQRIWGAAPEFVWPAVGDRVWVEGRWIFDCGHPNVSDDNDTAYVQYSTEVHPPRALATFRLNHPALDSFPVPRTSAPNFPPPQGFLPITGAPATVPTGQPNTGPTNVPVTEADIFVSVNGGGANDFCSIVGSTSCGDIFSCLSAPFSDCHTGPIIPVNDRNYVFDIYPPGTTYVPPLLADGTYGPFPVTPPVPNASLQWRIVDHFSELPAHACGGMDNTVCVTVDPIFCLIDDSTNPPPQDQTQTGTTCPSVPAQPTRLRVILPFAGSSANFFARSILLGWDDVPSGPPQNLLASANTKASVFARSVLPGPTDLPRLVGLPGPGTTPAVRTFKVSLRQLNVLDNANVVCLPPQPCVDLPADWRVFVNVGGQYRYMSQLFDGGPLFGSTGNPCNGVALTASLNGNCFQFVNTPWKVSIVDGNPIHVAVGGFAANGTLEGDFCHNYVPPTPPPVDAFDIPVFGGCNFSTLGVGLDLALNSFHRIGTYEFDLGTPDYAPPAPFTTQPTNGEQYQVEFAVEEIPAAVAPISALQIGDPHYINYVSSATPLVLSTADADSEYFQYRFHLQGAAFTTYASTSAMNNAYSTVAPSTLPFPVYWTSAPIDSVSHSASLYVGGPDGPYNLQYSAQSFGQLLEPRHTETVILDNTPPAIGIVQPQATAYPHSATLTLSYSVDDGTGSGVQGFTPTMDGATTLPGVPGLLSGQSINLLTAMMLGTHTFSVTASDNVNNIGTSSVTFTIIVTPDSIKGDVQQFLQSGAITNGGNANSLLAKLDAAAAARARGQCSVAANIYRAFINELQAQSGNHVDAAAAAIMIADAQYLIAHCP